MADVRCSVCGEPWELYGVHNGDMEPWEAKKFLAGEGCPSCNFGQSCPQCNGTGKEHCPICPWWQPRVGCPICGGKGHTETDCIFCEGTGKPSRTFDAAFEALEDECEASDEDPVEIMIRRGF